ncbi:MAG: SLBB domain-containing protein [Steroidobacteraceae bacterium]
MSVRGMPGRRVWRWLAGRYLPVLLAGALMVLPSTATIAQSALPSDAQLELLRNLTPEQREAIMRELGAGGTSSATPAGSSAQSGAVTPPDLDQALRRMSPDQLRALLIPSLKPGDTVLLEVDFPGRLTRLQPAPTVGAQVPNSAGPPGAGDAQSMQRADTQRNVVETTLTVTERDKLAKLIELLRSRNPYVLDSEGRLLLPGFPVDGIQLSGLNEEQATKRLQAVPELAQLEVRLTFLPLKRTGARGLRPYGYELFNKGGSAFAPAAEAPVPADYVVGAGDRIDVQLYGNENRNLALVVGRDGRISFPELGPIRVGGQRFSAVKSTIESRVAKQMIGVNASVSIGESRGIRVFVLGEARNPGSYTVSGLATVTTALVAAGGITEIGSMRDIQLKRQGAIVRRLDLYDLLLRGDTANDAKLLPGDAIFIPPVGATVALDGEVKRPAIYELKGQTALADVIALAGGFTVDADATHVSLTRVDAERRRVVMDVDLTTAAARNTTASNGDILRVNRLRPQIDEGVVTRGHLHRPGVHAWRPDLRISDVIPTIDELRPGADLHYVLIRRELPPDRRIAVFSADLEAAMRSPGSEKDIPLQPRDEITVFDFELGRARVIRPLLDELRLQSQASQPTEIVRVTGRVKVPGEYPLEPGMRIADLVRAGGGLEDSAYVGEAELTRYEVNGSDGQTAELRDINLEAALRGDNTANLELQAFDSLIVKEVPEWGVKEEVAVEGEVRFPGRYSIRRGETLRSILERAGGLTQLAFPEGAVFTREELREREQKQLDQLGQRLQGDLATLALQGAAANQAQAGTALSVGQSLLAQLQSTKAVGRLVIDVNRVLTGPVGGVGDIVLRSGDRLMIPKRRQEVTVLGEVQNATSHFYRPDLERDDYIALSGGTTRKADRGRIYVVRADGSVVGRNSSGWFRRASNIDIRPGDTVVVPLDTERIPRLPFWTAVTQILYNIAIAAAAVKTF